MGWPSLSQRVMRSCCAPQPGRFVLIPGHALTATLHFPERASAPLCGRRRVIGVLEAFSSWPFAFNEIDVRNLTLLAELVLGALKPEDEDRFTQSAEAAARKLETPKAEPPKREVKSAPPTAPVAAVAVKPAPVATPPVKAPLPVPVAPVQPSASAKVTVPAVAVASAAPVTPAAPYAASVKY